MDPHRGIQKRIIPDHIRHTLTGSIRRTDIDDDPHSVLSHGSKQFLPVFIKLPVIIMCMCIKDHNNPALSSSAVFADNSAGAISNTVLAPLSPAFDSRYAALA